MGFVYILSRLVRQETTKLLEPSLFSRELAKPGKPLVKG